MTEQKAAPAKPVKKSASIGGILLGIIASVSAIALLPTTLIILVGMVPTAVAYFVDTSREKTLGPTVLTLNFAGVIPALIKVWHDGHTVNNALQIITTPSILLFFLIPSAIGWTLFNYVPYLVIGIIRRKAQSRIADLKKYQEDLVEQWGPGIISYSSKHDSGSDSLVDEKPDDHKSITA